MTKFFVLSKNCTTLSFTLKLNIWAFLLQIATLVDYPYKRIFVNIPCLSICYEYRIGELNENSLSF
jgi:hypothetical protein